MKKTYLQSPIGWLEISGNCEGVSSILYCEKAPDFATEVPECLNDCVIQLEEYFAGKRKFFSLHLQIKGTEFQNKIWNELQKIPYGTTMTYMQMAKNLGDENYTRAVGYANGKNVINIVIPCHRVIGAKGKLTGYGGGLWRKEWLLKHEKQNISEGLFL